MATLNTTIILRNDLTANWLANNQVILQRGEVSIEFLANGKAKMKIGDGEKTWEQLSYFGGDAAKYFEVIPEVDENGVEIDIEAINRVVGDTELAGGDIAIVKSTFAPGKTQYTAYVYDEETSAWKAMDGNYSADNVYVAEDLTLAGNFTSVGNYNKGDTIAAGTSLQNVLSSMLQQELYPTADDKPSASISVSGGSGEVGSSYTLPTATLTIDDVGSYEYGDKATGITFAINSVELKQGSNSKKNDAVMSKGSTLRLQATDTDTLYTDSAKSYAFTATASYEQAPNIPVTNLGNPYEAARIPAGSVNISNKTATFSGYRYAFAGGTTAATLDSATIRAMTAKKSSKASMDSQAEALEFTAAQGATKVFFAYPATWTGTPYFEMFGLAWAENTDIVAKDNIQVADARGTVDGALQGAVAYKVYCWELDTPLQAESTKFRVWFK